MTRDEIYEMWSKNIIQLASCDPEKYIFQEGYVFTTSPKLNMERLQWLKANCKGKFISTTMYTNGKRPWNSPIEPDNTREKTLLAFEFAEDALKYKLLWGGQ